MHLIKSYRLPVNLVWCCKYCHQYWSMVIILFWSHRFSSIGGHFFTEMLNFIIFVCFILMVFKEEEMLKWELVYSEGFMCEQ